jgi:hypothetical protein
VSVPAAGISPAASFELNGFEPQKAPPTILADKIDPKTGEFASLIVSDTIAGGLVQYLTSVQRGSGAAVRAFGQRYREVTHNDERANETMESLTREALKPGVETGTLRFERILVESDAEDPTQSQTTVEFADLLAPAKNANQRKTFNP